MFDHLVPASDWGLLRLALTLVIVLFAGAIAACALALEAWHHRRMQRRQAPRALALSRPPLSRAPHRAGHR